MSGLRSSNCDGTPIGTAGGAALSAFTAIENVEGSLPVSTAIACSYCARATPRLISADCAFCKVFCASTTEISVPTPVSYSDRVNSSAFWSSATVCW